MAFSEFDLRLRDANGKLHHYANVRVDTSHPKEGEIIVLQHRYYRTVAVHHHADTIERQPRTTVVCYCEETTKPALFDDDAARARPSARVVQLPVGNARSLLPVEALEEKRVRAVSADQHTATTVEREVSMSQVERSLATMKTVPGRVAIPSNGGVMRSMQIAVQLPQPRHFVAEPEAAGEKVTLRVVMRPPVEPPPEPIASEPTLPMPVPAPVAVARRARMTGPLLGCVLVSAIVAGLMLVRSARRKPLPGPAVAVPSSNLPPLERPTPAPSSQPVTAPPATLTASDPVTGVLQPRHRRKQKTRAACEPPCSGRTATSVQDSPASSVKESVDAPDVEGDVLHEISSPSVN